MSPASPEKNPNLIADAFLEDHKVLTRGFADLLQAIEANDLENAIRIADEIDRKAGAHIRFEEEVLYLRVAENRGREYARNLYDEHRTVLHALQTLLESRGKGSLDPEVRKALLEEVHTGLDHAVSCGTLVSHLTTLDDDEQERLLARLLELRESAPRWTELANSSPDR